MTQTWHARNDTLRAWAEGSAAPVLAASVLAATGRAAPARAASAPADRARVRRPSV